MRMLPRLGKIEDSQIKITDYWAHVLLQKCKPDFANLAEATARPESATTKPQNICKPVQPVFKIAPAMGFPINSPIAIGMNSIPIRTPISSNDGHKVTVTTGGRDTKAPEKKLLPLS